MLLLLGTQHRDLIFPMHLKIITMINLGMICFQRYHTIIDYIWHIVHFISMIHLFHNWKFVALGFHLILSSPSPFLSGNHLLVLCIYNSVLLCLFICFIFEISHISETIQDLSFFDFFYLE